MYGGIQWNLFIKGTLNKGHLSNRSNEDTVCSPNHIQWNLPIEDIIGTQLAVL